MNNSIWRLYTDLLYYKNKVVRQTNYDKFYSFTVNDSCVYYFICLYKKEKWLHVKRDI